METSTKNYGYIEWLSAEEMHDATKLWLSELKFAKDEQRFLNSLVKSHTLQLTDKDVFATSKKLVEALVSAERELVILMKKVQSHENLLEIMVNGVDELRMEKAYLETHWQLTSETRKYLNAYRLLKTQLFDLVSKVMKKNKRLLT